MPSAGRRRVSILSRYFSDPQVYRLSSAGLAGRIESPPLEFAKCQPILG